MGEQAKPAAESPAAATPPSQSAPPAASKAAGSEAKPKVEDRAPSATGPSEFERKVFEQLDEGAPIEDARKRAREAQPAADTGKAPTGADAERGARTQPAEAAQAASQQATGKAPPKETAEPGGKPPGGDAVYDGLDAKSRQALSQTHLLPDAAVWEKLDLAQKANLLAASREILAGRSRDFQRQRASGNGKQRDEQGRFTQQTNGSGAGDTAQQPADAEPAAGTIPPLSTQPPTATRARGPAGDVRGQADPHEVEPVLQPDEVKALIDAYGEDGARPFIAVLERQQRSFNDRLDEIGQAHQSTQQRADAAIRQQLAGEERLARTALSQELPRLKEDTQAWGLVTSNAKMLAQAAFNAGQPWEWQECLLTAGRALFHTDIQQEAQRALAGKRQTSLRASPERGTEEQRPVNAMSKDEWEAAAFDALDQGKTVEEVQRMRSAG